MPSGIADAVASFFAQEEGTIQHFMIFGAGKPGGFVVAFRNDSICVVYADFGAGIDAVLAFPEFNQPSPAAVIKVDGEGIKNHLKTGCHIVIEPGIPGFFLPGIRGGRKDAAVAMETVAEGLHQFIYQRTFGTAVHGQDFTDDFLLVAVRENTA